MKKSRRAQDDEPEGLTYNPFAALRPEGSPAPERAPEPEEPEASSPEPGARVLVQREKKGRAGKTVTRVSGLGLDASRLAALARDLKRALGCGATVEGEDVLLQGAQTERAAAWLEKHTGARVTVGN